MLRYRRLPGFRFEVQDPPPSDVLPRLDVACFVGFASRGPLHRPVRVASIAQFEMIFGDDARLAWDETRGEPMYGYLASAVRAFFRNGGRLAWIIRVAGEAQADHFPISGLLQVDFDEYGEVAEIRPAYAQARSPGSWADAIRVYASLTSRSVVLTPTAFNLLKFDAVLTSPDDLVVGDLLRLAFDNGSILMCAVKSIEPGETSPLQPNHYTVAFDKAVWFQSSWQHLPSTQKGQAFSFTHDTTGAGINVTVPLRFASPISLDWPTQDNPFPIQLDLDLPYADAPQLGSFLRVIFNTDELWLRVEEVTAAEGTDSPPLKRIRVGGQGLWWTPNPDSLPGSIGRAERLFFELWTRTGRDNTLRISDLTFDPRHTRYWDALPTDLQLFPGSATVPRTDRRQLWSMAAEPRFPLAGAERSNVLFVPLAMPFPPDFHLAPDRMNEDALTRDGLKFFDANLFLDQDLAEVGVRDLINVANTLRYQAPQPRALTGIHAVLDIDEATMIVVPDAIQRGWSRHDAHQPPPPQPSAPPERPQWWHFLSCDPKPDIPRVHEPEWGNFLNCDIRVIEPPDLSLETPDPLNTFTLKWEPKEPNLIFVLEEATQSDFEDGIDIYKGREEQYALYGHAPGVFYYRVRGFAGDQSTDWSNGIVVNIESPSPYQLRSINPDATPPNETYSADVLLNVQRAVLRLCAARGDLFAVFALPEHYREDETLAHIQTLTTGSSGFLGSEEPRTLSFGALYHPWLIGREENCPGEFRRTPPDGAMAGIIAQRTLRRGAWLAPANEFLKGVVALTPSMDRNRWQEFQDAGLNLIRHEPKGFTVLNNDTLTSDEDLRPINVRRLLILLRRLATRLGATYVFEPNDAAFRRSVQRGFDALLDDMFRRGAFAGATAGASYQVTTDTPVNTPQTIDQGRFIVELRIAPSLPLRFMTIRLVQTGDRMLVMQEA
jgi:hypothetical protein